MTSNVAVLFQKLLGAIQKKLAAKKTLQAAEKAISTWAKATVPELLKHVRVQPDYRNPGSIQVIIDQEGLVLLAKLVK